MTYNGYSRDVTVESASAPEKIPHVFLSVFMDRGYWRSSLEILGPPCGTSFYRDFNYRNDLVHQHLRETIDALLGPPKAKRGENAHRVTEELPAVICLRFHDEENTPSNNFIPVRHATVQFRHDDEYSASIVLQEYIGLDETTHDFHLLEIDSDLLDVGGTFLAWRGIGGQIETIATWEKRKRSSIEFWEALATSQLLPTLVRDRLNGLTVITAHQINKSRDGKIIEPTAIESSNPSIIRAFCLEVGESYDVELTGRRIVERGSTAEVAIPEIVFVTDSELVATGSPMLRSRGNYRNFRPWIRPCKQFRTPVELCWDGRQESEDAHNLVGLRLLAVARAVRPWPSIWWAICVFLLSAASFVTAFIEPWQRAVVAPSFSALGAALFAFSTVLATRAMDVWQSQQ